MMKYLPLMILLFSCAHRPVPQEKDDMVTLETALWQAQASYLKGCVDALKDLKITAAFRGCRDKSILHRRELDSIMEQDI